MDYNRMNRFFRNADLVLEDAIDAERKAILAGFAHLPFTCFLEQLDIDALLEIYNPTFLGRVQRVEEALRRFESEVAASWREEAGLS
jgi:hypothetical protein